MSLDNLHSQAAQVGSATKFDALFQEHWPKVFGVIFRLVGDPDEAEDLALEAFLKLHRKLEGPGSIEIIPIRGSLSGWLYRVATNLGLNALRARKRREKYELEAGRLYLEATPLGNPATAVELAEDRHKVRKILSQMKTRSAKILVLRHSGLSYAEIASAIRVSPKSVGKLLSRAEKDFEQRYRAQEGS